MIGMWRCGKMQCMKCGKNTEGSQVFCSSCMENMARYPVKPGTPITLPKHDPAAAFKKSAARKRLLLPDEQILILRKHLRRSRLLSLILAILLCAACTFLLFEVFETTAPDIGRNYTIDTTQETN